MPDNTDWVKKLRDMIAEENPVNAASFNAITDQELAKEVVLMHQDYLDGKYQDSSEERM